MNDPSQKPLKRLFGELHRRHVWQVLVVYLGTSYAIIEATDLFSERFGLPDWIFTGVTVLLLLGLPVVLVTAYLQQERLPGFGPRDGRDRVPAEGAVAAPGSAPEPTAEPSTAAQRLFTWRNAITGGVVAFALWGIVAAGWLLFGPGLDAANPGVAPGGEARPSIAVLPLENMSPDPDNAYFADGIHDEILTRLSKVGALKVISRTSVLEYRESPKNVRTVAEELGVRHILEGSVRRAGDRVRITAQLIDARSDEHLWAETYDRELTAAHVFEIQGEIAQRISSELRAQVTPEELRRLASRPTQNLEAYDYFLRGNDYWYRGGGEEAERIANEMFQKAVELDPSFALAHARLAESHAFLWWYHFDRSEERLAMAEEAVQTALSLDPDLPEAHAAAGYFHYWGRLDYDRALEEFAIALEAQPSNAWVHAGIASVQRRQGKMRQAADNFSRALELDPRSTVLAVNLQGTYRLLRDAAAAHRVAARIRSLSPDRASGYVLQAITHAGLEGDTEKARAVLDEARRAGLGDDPGVRNLYIEWDILDGRYREALERLEGIPSDVLWASPWHFEPTAQVNAEVHGLLGDRRRERAYYDSARALLEEKVRERPDDERFRSALGIAYAGLGRKEDAIREGERGAELMPMSRDAWRGGERVQDLARIYAMVGEHDAAIDRLESLLAVPSSMTVPRLRLDPVWAPLRDHPRFQSLLEERESR